ncbi:unnamed protein product [Caenorhabditis bovis]|uniref:PARP-type domain-containing protein n=1 Tax=Caenorhabditis bovis TaxID=2654633 RepID=A0A8S1EW70_9PELO|nr:unnamed protein product [Caenorhabditis bovis]
MSTSTTRFCTDYGKRVAKCQKCKMQLEKGSLRLGKIVPNFFLAQKDDSKPPPDMKQYFHKNCLFEMLFKARATTKVIESTEDLEGFDDLNAEDQDDIKKLIGELMEKRSKDGDVVKTPKNAKKPPKKSDETEETMAKKPEKRKIDEAKPREFDETSKYNSLYKFSKACEVIGSLDSSKEKKAAINAMVSKDDFDGDLRVWLVLLLREKDENDYHVNEENLKKYFAKILNTEEDELEAGDNGDLSQKIREKVESIRKNGKSDWSIQKALRYLEKLATISDDDQRQSHFKFATKRLSPIELQCLIRLSLKDLHTNLTVREAFDAIHPNCFKFYEKNGENIEKTVEKYYAGALEEPKAKKSSEPPSKKSRKPKKEESDDSEAMSESEEESFVSDDDDDVDSDADSDDLVSDGSSEDVSSSSSSEDDDNFEKAREKLKVPRGTRSRPLSNKNTEEKCPPGMTACWYGAQCYRKNPEHKQEYWHPTASK